jgi:hypothetical protein
MNTHKIYDVLATTGFLLFAGGLVISKFTVSLGIVTLIILAPFVFLSGKRIKTERLSPFLPLIGTYILLVCSILICTHKDHALHELLVQNGMLTVPIITIAHWSHLKKRAYLIVHFLFAVAITAGLITLFFYSLPVEIAKEWTVSFSLFQEYPDVINKTQFGLYSPFIDRLHFAYALCYCALCSLFLSFKKGNVLYLWCAGFFILMILLLGARGAQLALLFASLPFLIYYLKIRYPEMEMWSWSTLSFCMIFLILVPLISYEMIPSIKNRYNQMKWEMDVMRDGSYINYDYQHFTTLSRLKSLEYSIDMVLDKPIFGTGIGDVDKELKEIYEAKGPNIPAHHQNYYLYLWMAGGIFTLISFLLFQIGWLRSFLIGENYSPLIKNFAISYSIFVALILMIDAVMKYHLGVFGIPFFFVLINVLTEKRK